MDELADLHSRYAATVRAYVLRRSDAETAEEVCAEVWTVAWRRLGDVPVKDPLPWLFGVARRVLANERRRQRRQRALIDRLVARGSAGVVGPPGIPADPVLGAALRRLSPADAEILLLVAWEDLSPQRAAAALGIRPRTFAVRLHRARKRLQAALDAELRSSTSTPTPSIPETTP